MEAWLTTVAKNAAIDETKSLLHLRATNQKMYVRRLDGDLGELDSFTLVPSHDPTTQVLDFLREEPSLRKQHDILEHFRFCSPVPQAIASDQVFAG